MTAVSPAVKKISKEEDLQALPEEGFLHEVVDGELIMSPSDFKEWDWE